MTGAGTDEAKREPFIWSKNSKNKVQTNWEPDSNNTPDKIAVDVEQKNTASMYNWYKNLIQARRASEILSNGELTSTNYHENGLIIFKRTFGNDSMLIIHNMSNTKKQITLNKEDKIYKKIYFSTDNRVVLDEKVTVPKYSTLILQQ